MKPLTPITRALLGMFFIATDAILFVLEAWPFRRASGQQESGTSKKGHRLI
ncbi:MAG: hypothetical protein JWN86_1802 [Planctomycetota bacterium]|nr:hypothetical protein [Planctomycetota bacterium]